MFVDREAELEHLERLYRADRAEFFVLYGRRRVGKTELLRTFCRDKPHVFFIATLSSDADQLAAFSQDIWRFSQGSVPEGFSYPSWEAAFEALASLPHERGRPIVVLDEFTYLTSGNRVLPSILQKVWDRTLKDSRVFLVLCGSYIGMMERDVLDHQAPLYGRRTGILLLQPLELPAAAAFFPGYTPVEQIQAWAVLGGMPYYLRSFSDEIDLMANVGTHILSVNGTLYSEPRLLLMEELRQPRNYFSILRAIAQGKTRLNEITQSAQVGDGRATAHYLDVLQQMHLVRRAVPASESKPKKSRKGIYQITDPFLRFWFRFVHPFQGSLELGLVDAVLEQRVIPSFNQFLGYGFEEASREYLARLARAGALPFLPERIGGWWDQNEEIDLVAISDSEGAILLGECKWSVHPVGLNILVELKRKARVLERLGKWPAVSYALFSRSGFTPDLQIVAASEGVRLVHAQDLLRAEPPG
jgi:AAA+ ATPase superfamily predicted ATPase